VLGYAIGMLGWLVAAVLGGVMLGEFRADRRFDDMLAAKFGEEPDGGEPRTVAELAGDEDEDDGPLIFDQEALPRATDEDGTEVRIVWVVPGPKPWEVL